MLSTARSDRSKSYKPDSRNTINIVYETDRTIQNKVNIVFDIKEIKYVSATKCILLL